MAISRTLSNLKLSLLGALGLTAGASITTLSGCNSKTTKPLKVKVLEIGKPQNVFLSSGTFTMVSFLDIENNRRFEKALSSQDTDFIKVDSNYTMSNYGDGPTEFHGAKFKLIPQKEIDSLVKTPAFIEQQKILKSKNEKEVSI